MSDHPRNIVRHFILTLVALNIIDASAYWQTVINIDEIYY